MVKPKHSASYELKGGRIMQHSSSEGIPAIQLEFQIACKDIYMYTADAQELIDFTTGMC